MRGKDDDMQFPRYFRSTKTPSIIIRFDSKNEAFWIKSKHPSWPIKSRLSSWEKYVERGYAEEITEAEALAKAEGK